MMSLFHPPDCEALRRRFVALEPEGPRLWGRMDAAQMLAHCAKGLEAAMADRPVKQVLLGRLVAPLLRPLVLGERPFRRNAHHLRDLALDAFTTRPEVAHIQTSLIFEWVRKPGLPNYRA